MPPARFSKPRRYFFILSNSYLQDFENLAGGTKKYLKLEIHKKSISE